MTVTAADVEWMLDRLALVATRSTPAEQRRLICLKRRLERELEQLQSVDDELADLKARLQRPGARERLAAQTIPGSNGSAMRSSSAARHSSVPPAP